LDITPIYVQEGVRVPALPLEDEGAIHAASEPHAARDYVQRVVGLHHSEVVDDEQCDVVLTGYGGERINRLAVLVVLRTLATGVSPGLEARVYLSSVGILASARIPASIASPMVVQSLLSPHTKFAET
jgi:hypothetical protein